MNRKTNWFSITISLILLLALLWGSYYIFKKSNLKNTITENLPGISSLDQTNLPGKLLGPQNSDKAKELESEKIIYWTNYYRAQEGLPALSVNNDLIKAAESKKTEMFALDYFEHVSPSGQTPAELVLSMGYQYKVTGENLALGDFKDEKDLVDAWMASPGHKANILNKDYKEIGVSSGLDDYEQRTTWISVQEFGVQAPNCPIPSKTLSNQINDKKAQYQEMQNKLTEFTNEAQSLINQGNQAMQTGNEIYNETGSKKKAQSYWDEGKALQNQAQAKFNEAKKIQTQMNSLYNEINSLVSQYNSQVNQYNSCIKN